MAYTLRDIAKIVQAEWLEGSGPLPEIRHYITDSRRIIFPSQACFWALGGERRDGHAFIQDVYQSGVRNFVVSEMPDRKDMPDAHFALVPNVLTALQKLAAYHRSKFSCPVLGITGSNGKTVVKEWISYLLQHDVDIVRSPGSYNSQLGVPLSVLQMEEQHELALFEAGISQKGEMANLSEIIHCNIGIFVSLGSAHDAGFTSREEKLQEKLRLFQYSEALIYCADDEMVHQAALALQANNPSLSLLNWSAEGQKNLYFTVKSMDKSNSRSTRLSCVFQGDWMQIDLPFSHAIDLQNALHCVVFLLHQGYTAAQIEHRFRQVRHLDMRLELKTGLRNTLLINDTYSNDPESLQAALAFLQQQAGLREMGLIISGFREQTNASPDAGVSIIRELLDRYKIQFLIGIGAEIKTLVAEKTAQGQKAWHFSDTDALIRHLDELPIDNMALLCKASRVYGLEKAIPYLSARTHKARLQIDLEAMRHNVEVYTRFLSPGTSLMIMLKAHAYGSGDIELARFFQDIRCDYIAVAVIDEAIKLRQSGIATPILVLNPDPDYCHLLIKYRLHPEVYSLEHLKALLQRLNPEEQLSVQIKLDTGMHRLGFEERELPELLSLLNQDSRVKVSHVFTHLACASDPDCDAFSLQQLRHFEKCYDILKEGLEYKPGRHALNSSGILRFPYYHMDMVRLGIGMYGVLPEHPELKQTHTLVAGITQVRRIAAGESVGYDRAWRASRPSVIAVVNIGYADGLMRQAGMGRFSFLIRGQKAPIIGKVCMDMCMVDVTHMDGISSSDEAIVFSPEYPVSILAKACETTPYEILSRLSERITRVYRYVN